MKQLFEVETTFEEPITKLDVKECLCKVFDPVDIVEVTEIEWIRVNDKLPKFGEYLVIVKSRGIFIDFYDDKTNTWNNKDVTHYQPLPKYPKEL